MRRTPTALAVASLGLVLALGSTGTAGAAPESVPQSARQGTGAASGLATDASEDALLARINATRAGEGLPAIRSLDVCTDALAEKWGEHIARTGRLEHRDQRQVIRRCDGSWAGETLVRGTDLTPDDMLALWMDSPGHREILMSPRARRAGIAITTDGQGRTIGVVNLVRVG